MLPLLLLLCMSLLCFQRINSFSFYSSNNIRNKFSKISYSKNGNYDFNSRSNPKKYWNIQAQRSDHESDVSLSPSLKLDEGVTEFNAWWPGSKDVLQALPHALFSNGALRGLEATSSLFSSDNVNNEILKVPKAVCLSAPYDDDQWDANLALQLLHECKLGEQSQYYGYCALLCQGKHFDFDSSKSAIPPWTAPNALRHWSEEEKEQLSVCEAGSRLLQIESDQAATWKQKFEKCSTTYSYPQFCWAMEAIHSRAFKGLSMDSSKNSILTVAAQTIAGAVGIYGIMQPNDFGELIAIGSAFVILIPLLISIFKQGSGNVVLLPYIDSANHLKSADSAIEFDPLQDSFILRAGSNCYVKDQLTGQVQLYITYGERSDAELLLNYGFINDFILSPNRDENIRQKLAKEFVRRQR